jgi:Ca2+/H+ antiporter, TMEM165/GDT1 family
VHGERREPERHQRNDEVWVEWQPAADRAAVPPLNERRADDDRGRRRELREECPHASTLLACGLVLIRHEASKGAVGAATMEHMGSSATWGLVGATFTASFVEFVEALTIVLAMGATRSWRSALAGAALAVVGLAGFTAIAGYALVNWLPRSALQLGIGTLLLIFGLQWLRKAILRASGLKALHDEEEEYRGQAEAARRAGDEERFGLDWFAFVVSFKGTFLEGVEVVFIVITFGLNAHDVPLAAGGAAAAGAVVLAAGAIVHRPLARVPENTLKYIVGLLLSSFGTFWAVEGLGVFQAGGESLRWPGDNWSLVALLAVWFALSQLLIRAVPAIARVGRPAAAHANEAS